MLSDVSRSLPNALTGCADMQTCAVVSLRLATAAYVCCRNLEEGETELKGNEKLLLDLICKAYYLPEWCSINDYRAIFEAQGLRVCALI